MQISSSFRRVLPSCLTISFPTISNYLYKELDCVTDWYIWMALERENSFICRSRGWIRGIAKFWTSTDVESDPSSTWANEHVCEQRVSNKSVSNVSATSSWATCHHVAIWRKPWTTPVFGMVTVRSWLVYIYFNFSCRSLANRKASPTPFQSIKDFAMPIFRLSFPTPVHDHEKPRYKLQLLCVIKLTLNELQFLYWQNEMNFFAKSLRTDDVVLVILFIRSDLVYTSEPWRVYSFIYY